MGILVYLVPTPNFFYKSHFRKIYLSTPWKTQKTRTKTNTKRGVFAEKYNPRNDKATERTINRRDGWVLREERRSERSRPVAISGETRDNRSLWCAGQDGKAGGSITRVLFVRPITLRGRCGCVTGPRRPWLSLAGRRCDIAAYRGAPGPRGPRASPRSHPGINRNQPVIATGRHLSLMTIRFSI